MDSDDKLILKFPTPLTDIGTANSYLKNLELNRRLINNK